MPNPGSVGQSSSGRTTLAAQSICRACGLALIVAVVAACGDNKTQPADARPDGSGLCGTVTTEYPLVADQHVAVCSVIAYASNPPTSGPHYPNWAKFKAFPSKVGRPFLVHDLEHGAIVVTYNCPEGCADDVAALTTMLAARPADSLCSSSVRNRFVVAPDPDLDVRFAATAWGFSLRSNCFDLSALSVFIDDHYGRAPEKVCADGIDVLDPRNGFPANCP
jgi:hypothetical protein